MRHSSRCQVVVITGASSGIPRASALAFARTGARLVLAARRESVLCDVIGECQAIGAEAIAIPTDVTDPEAVDNLARSAVAHFGQIDIWINSAAVLHFGRFDETPLPVVRQVLETNLFGYIHGARAAIRQFREQGNGTLINICSMLGVVAQPYAGAYVASKFAIRGLSECLRQELQDEPDIHVCTVLPAAVDTPVYQHAANYLGRAVRPIRPLYPASAVADVIVSLAQHPRREAYAGTIGPLISFQKAIAPALTERIVRMVIDLVQIRRLEAPASSGNLFEPIDDRRAVSGGWRVWADRFPAEHAALVGMIAAVLVGAALVYRRSRAR